MSSHEQEWEYTSTTVDKDVAEHAVKHAEPKPDIEPAKAASKEASGGALSAHPLASGELTEAAAKPQDKGLMAHALSAGEEEVPEPDNAEQPKKAAPPPEDTPSAEEAAPASGITAADGEQEREESGDADPNPTAVGPRGVLGGLARTAGTAVGILSDAPGAAAHVGGAAKAAVAHVDAASSHVAGGLRGVAAGVAERAGELGSTVQALGAALGDKAGQVDKAASEVASEVKTAAAQVGEKLPIDCHGGDLRGLGQELKGLTVAAGDKVVGALGAISAASNSLAADLKGSKGAAGEAAAGVDSTTSEIAGAVRDAGGAIADATPINTERVKELAAGAGAKAQQAGAAVAGAAAAAGGTAAGAVQAAAAKVGSVLPGRGGAKEESGDGHEE
ncbi:hypothetical protein WJX81_006764 [Elliptochloris bilobata]|uniref:Uncharacterized protein n=1 Tax=Elliptochloris bilobata TaxID=381761 RepID=A0AAW1RXT3_9CHLO